MGSVTSGIGLASGIDINSIVDQLMSIEARPRTIVQNQVAVLEAQKGAFLSINSRVLALEATSNTLKDTNTFEVRNTSVSNPDVLSATASSGAPLGSYDLAVGRLATNQQMVSAGYANEDITIGAGTLTFESAKAKLIRNTSLSDLNGGDGIQRGKIQITDRSGNTATVDLTRVATINDVLEEINNTSGVNVSARVAGDKLQITDNTGQTASDLIISNIGSFTTATSLGIEGNSGGTNTIAGNNINYLSLNTAVESLNDGLGIRTNAAGQTDLIITKHDGSTANVDLAGVSTISDVIDAINAVGGSLQAALGDDGYSLKLTDSDPFSGTQLEVASGLSSSAARDLGFVTEDSNNDGILEGDRLIASINSVMIKNLNGGTGVTYTDAVVLTPDTLLADLFNGAGLSTNGTGATDFRISPKDTLTSFTIDIDSLNTVQDFIDAVDTASSGDITITIENNIRLVATENTGGPASFVISDQIPSTAIAELGLTINHPSDQQVTGNDTNPLATTMLSLGEIEITNRAGTTTSVSLAAARSVSEILDAINNAGAGVTAALNNAGNGFVITDNTGSTASNLIITDLVGTAATELGLAANVAANSTDTGDLDLKYISESTQLSTLNNGNGVSAGKFKIYDSSGASSTVDLTQGERTLGEVIDEINSRPVAITAAINSTGDGIILTDNAAGPLAMMVEEETSSTAADLGILGADTALTGSINGSFEKQITVEATDTLEDIVQKIIDEDMGITASLINDGSAVKPTRLSLSSDNTGTAGAFIMDAGGLNLSASVLSEAKNASVFFGAGDPASAILITSSDNTLENTIGGLSIDLLATSDQPVTITVERNNADVSSAVSTFVTAFNGLLDSLDQHDSYDAETEQKGLLLGNGTILAMRSRLYRMINSPLSTTSGPYSRLSQIGISIDETARLTVDDTKLTSALEQNPSAIKALFTASEIVTAPEVDVDLPPGVTVPDATNLNAIGFAQQIAELLKSFTDQFDGTLTNATNNIDSRISLANSRIDQINLQLDSKRARLEQQFLAMEQAISQLQSQGSSLAALQQLATNSNNNS